MCFEQNSHGCHQAEGASETLADEQISPDTVDKGWQRTEENKTTEAEAASEKKDHNARSCEK